MHIQTLYFIWEVTVMYVFTFFIQDVQPIEEVGKSHDIIL